MSDKADPPESPCPVCKVPPGLPCLSTRLEHFAREGAVRDPHMMRRFRANGYATQMAKRQKRGYSTEFKPHGKGKRYMLDRIPAGLWSDVKARAKREGVSLRALILQLLKEWSER